jgi:hypothetical protein
MLWHNPWYSRYNKLYTNAYGVHIQNAQWSGPGNEYFNRFSFTRDGVLNLPPSGVIRSNDWQSSSWYDPIQDEYINNDSFQYSTDSSLTFDANTISVSRGSLSMNGVGKNGSNWIAMAGSFGQNNFSTAQEGSCVDNDGNTYTLQSASPGGPNVTAVTKWSPTGERLWQRDLFSNNSTGSFTISAYPVGISCDATSGNLFIALNDYSNTYDNPVFVAMDTNGNQGDPAGVAYSPTRDIDINDVAGFGNTVGFAAVGRAANGQHFVTPDTTGITQAIPNRLIITGGSFGAGPIPDPTQSAWYMFGTGISGNVAINNVNNFDYRYAGRLSGSGTGTDASFNVSYTPGGAYQVTIGNNAGTNYDDTDVLSIAGTSLGGATPANDVTFHITTDAGVIIGINTVTGTATSNYALGLAGNPVDFTSIATPTILAYTSTDALFITNYVFGPGPTAQTFGNIGWDTFNAVAFDTINTDNNWTGNVYVGGRYHPTGNNGPRRSVLAKIVPGMGPTIQWQKELDDYTGRNEIRGIAVDTTGNVATIAINNNRDSVVTKVSSEGTMLWQRIVKNTYYAPSYDNDTYGIGVDSNNNFIITARATRNDDFNNNNEDIVVASFDTYGSLNWARSLGTIQNDYSLWDRTFHDITVKDDTMVITGYTYAGGFRVTHPGTSNGFVAKLPADGTGLGHYGEWRYQNLSLEIEIVSNTSAVTASLAYLENDISEDSSLYVYANVAVRSSGADPEFLTPSITYPAGGPGAITGLNELRFTDGTAITHGQKITRYTSAVDSTNVGATVIDPTSTKVFLAGNVGIAASYSLGAGLYDGQQIQFFPQGTIASTGLEDIRNVRVYLPKPYHPDSNQASTYDTGVWPYYPFTHLGSTDRHSLATATWNAEDGVWILDPWEFD